MTCEKYKEQLHDMLDGKLPLRLVRTLTEHELNCPMCYALREEMQDILFSLHNLDKDIEVPEDLSVLWRQRLRSERQNQTQRIRRTFPIRAWVALAAVIIILAVGTALVHAGLIEGTKAGNGAVEFASQIPDGDKSLLAAKGLKIIQNAKFEAESSEFDAGVQSILNLAKATGGWASHRRISDESGNGAAYSARTAEMTVRVPASQVDYFASKLSDFTSVRRRDLTAEERSDEYNQTAALLSGYEATLERLSQRQRDALTLEDILLIETEMSSVQALITMTAGKLSEWDMLEAYAQIDIVLIESVPVDAANASLTSRMAVQFTRSFAALGQYFKDMLVFVVSAAPWLLLLVALASAALLIERIHWRSRQM